MIKTFNELKEKIEKLTGMKFERFKPNSKRWGKTTFQAVQGYNYVLVRDESIALSGSNSVFAIVNILIPFTGAPICSKTLSGTFSDMDLLYSEIEKLWKEHAELEASRRERMSMIAAEGGAR